MIQTKLGATTTTAHQEQEQECCAKPHELDPELHDSHGHHQAQPGGTTLNRTALMATIHCLTGCTIGEVLGMVLGTAFGWSNWPTVVLAVALAFLFGYGMTLWPLRRAGMAWGTAVGLAFASDTLSMTTMEIVDNAIMLVIPGAMGAGLLDPLFWASLLASLVLAGAAAFPVNRWLIARGKGHALVHAHHGC
ncbi:MAG: DUF4396 domain-containing protein [Nitrospirota bacterium]